MFHPPSIEYARCGKDDDKKHARNQQYKYSLQDEIELLFYGMVFRYLF